MSIITESTMAKLMLGFISVLLSLVGTLAYLGYSDMQNNISNIRVQVMVVQEQLSEIQERIAVGQTVDDVTTKELEKMSIKMDRLQETIYNEKP